MTTATLSPSTNFIQAHITSLENTEKKKSEPPGPIKSSFHIDFRDDHQGEQCESALKSRNGTFPLADNETPMVRRSASDDDLLLHGQPDTYEDPSEDWIETERDSPARHIKADANNTQQTGGILRPLTSLIDRGARYIGINLASCTGGAFDVIMAENTDNKAAQPPTRINNAQQNEARANSLKVDLEKQLEKLDKELFATTGTHIFQVEASRQDAQQALTTLEQAKSLFDHTQGTAHAMLQTAKGSALGVALVGGGVTTAGLLGPAFAVATVAIGIVKVLNDLSNFSAEANQAQIRATLDAHLPGINETLIKLDSIGKQEQNRKVIKHRLIATMAMRMEYFESIRHSLNSAQNALTARHAQQGTVPPPQVILEPLSEQLAKTVKAKIVSPTLESSNHATLDKLKATALQANEMYRATEYRSLFTQSYESLYHLIAALIHGIDVQRERLFLSLPLLSTHENVQDVAIKAVEEAEAAEQLQEATFKRNYREALEEAFEEEILPGDEYQMAGGAAAMRMKVSKSSSDLTSPGLWRSIVVGANIFNMIQVSDPTYGTIDYTSAAQKNNKCNTLPSNLTTVRSIAHYLEMEAHTPYVEDRTLTTVSKNPDGSYSVADPGRKHYKFLAGAPSASGNFLDRTPTDLLDTSAARMSMYDYSGLFPGRTNTMEFEPAFDSTGAPVLTVRFFNQDKASVARHNPDTVLTYIDAHKKKQQTPTESREAIDFSDMSADEIYAYQLKLQSVGIEQSRLLSESYDAYNDVDLWNNRMYERRPTA